MRSERAALQQGQRGGDLQRGGRAEPTAFGHGAADQQVGRRQRESGVDQFAGHAERVGGPMLRGLQAGQGVDAPFAKLLLLLGINAQHAVAIGRGGHVGSQFQGHGKHKAQGVIGVLANQVDAPRCAENAQALDGAELFAKRFDHGGNTSESDPRV